MRNWRRDDLRCLTVVACVRRFLAPPDIATDASSILFLIRFILSTSVIPNSIYLRFPIE